nr:MAG TPA: hypothetical protein [Caudoviricetes sp.]
MSKYQKMLLKYAYDNYLKTSKLECKFLPQNGDMLMHSLTAAELLQNDDYIEVYSDNLYQNTLNIVKNTIISDDIIIWFKLTQKGLDFARTNFE